MSGTDVEAPATLAANQTGRYAPVRNRPGRLRSFWQGMMHTPSGMIGVFLLAFLLLVAAFGPTLVSADPVTPSLADRLDGPSWEHWFGTDQLGRDILSRVVAGSRISLSISFLAVACGLSVGTFFGMLAGYRRGKTETLIMRTVDIMMAIPGFLVALIVVAILGTGTTNLVIAMAIYSIPLFARIAHSSSIVVGRREFVEAARALGSPDHRILRREVAPNIVSPLIVQATIRLGTTLLTAASLSFLGLVAQPPEPEWGAMLAEGRSYVNTGPHVLFFPGAAIMIATLGFNLVGDALRDYLDPQYRKESS